ncbi:MAG: SDR family NAD(P)-dependent oxidoreductase [Albidovulum sp.]|nr:SDR family NAD(P)-dependent oxidoreductase [Albidovulum sp.]MDE0307504.1 SDR family NAD(P)-dependent oxidoreductase [Albidovulum sp.]MDE0534020.1 SDR family NAD(P)-dependent oxidoreductase [Albidovulum sp.]
MATTAKYPDLDGRSVFITGGGSGIGAALTEAFLEQGSKVAFVQRTDATEFCSELESRLGNRPRYIPCDVTDIEALRSAIVQAASENGPISVLVSNAANDVRHRTEELTPADWDKNQAINLRPYFFAAQAVVGGMKDLGGGSIINFSSISYMMGLGEYPSYVAANAGINGLTRGLAREFGGFGIRVNSVMPGWVLTEKQLRLWATPERLAAHLERQCLPEHLEPKDIAGGVLFLASQASKMMTGQALVIDGGVVVSG